MDKHCENVILTSHNAHVILKFCGVDIYMFSRKHPDDIILKPVEIHLDICSNGIVCAGC